MRDLKIFYLPLVIIMLSCSTDQEADFSSSIIDELLIIAPASPGGGWDQTARLIQDALIQEGLVRNAQVINIPGAGGSIGLAQLANGTFDGSNVIMMSGLIMLGATITNDSPITLNDTEALARLIGEYEVLVVPASSPYQSLDEFLDAWRLDPGSLAVAGGSAGGTDHMLLGLMAIEQGINPSEINYLPHSGGGDSLASILGGHVAAGLNGLGELLPFIQSERVTALAVSSPERIEGIEIPTFIELGHDIELSNWRSVITYSNQSAETIEAYSLLIERLVATDSWGEIVERNNWSDLYLEKNDFDSFMTSEQIIVADVLESIGLN
jgi:putative tricarboxylic transport membrane protein